MKSNQELNISTSYEVPLLSGEIHLNGKNVINVLTELYLRENLFTFTIYFILKINLVFHTLIKT